MSFFFVSLTGVQHFPFYQFRWFPISCLNYASLGWWGGNCVWLQSHTIIYIYFFIFCIVVDLLKCLLWQQELKDIAEQLVHGNLAILGDGLEKYQEAVDNSSSVGDLVSLQCNYKKTKLLFKLLLKFPSSAFEFSPVITPFPFIRHLNLRNYCHQCCHNSIKACSLKTRPTQRKPRNAGWKKWRRQRQPLVSIFFLEFWIRLWFGIYQQKMQ